MRENERKPMEDEDKSNLISNEVPDMCGATFGYKGLLRMYFVRAIEDPQRADQTHTIFDETSGGEAELKSGEGVVFVTFNDVCRDSFFKPESIDSSDSLTFSEREDIAYIVNDNGRSSRNWAQNCYVAEDFMLRSAAHIATYYMEADENERPAVIVEAKTLSAVIRGKPDLEKLIWLM